MSINDSLNNSHMIMQMENFAKLDSLYAMEDSYKTMELTNSKYRIQIGVQIIIIIALIFLITMYIVFRRNKKKKVIFEETIKTVKEEATESQENVRKAAFISNTYNSAKVKANLLEIIRYLETNKCNENDDTKEDGSEQQKAIIIDHKSLKDRLTSIIKEDNKEFTQYAKEASPALTKKLLEINPDFSPNDIKIATLIAMNLSSKEIAEIMFQSVRTIESTRYRIRKKLNLEQNANLGNFLMGLN